MRDLISHVFLVLGAVASPYLRNTHQSVLIDVSRHNVASRSLSDDWDYDDEGKSWTMGECSNTENQSPVNFSTTVAAAAPDSDTFFFKYPLYETPVMMKNDGKVLYNYFDNADGKVGGFALGLSYPSDLTVEYYIYKMIIHSPSEHTFNGVKVPCEVQLFHYKKDATLTNGEPAAADTAVVAVGFAESSEEASPFLLSLLDGGLPDQRGEERMVNRGHPSVLHFTELMRAKFGAHDAQAGFWQYTGSLTQPPCSSGVTWFVRTDTLNAKKQTLKAISQATKKSSGGIPFNARTLQTVGTRAVFPRFATDATHMETFNIEVSETFKESIDKAKDEQAKFQEALASDTGNASSSANATETQTTEYKTCLSELGEAIESLSTAKSLEESACNARDAAQNTLDQSEGGAERLEASTQVATLSMSCLDEQERVKALENERDAIQTQCDNLESTDSSTTTLQAA
mmetsp:Transcript_114435/g.180180  ORF Transcript_114435/g.180180 Transcript_114435/m.180180 type:complete len:458 (-) Transcript_114435:81-1454(-)